MNRVHGAFGLLVLTGALVRQSALSQFGLTEAAAREMVMSEVKGGGTDNRPMSARSYSRLVVAGRAAYQKVPAASRAQVTVSLFAWAKVYVASPAFKAAYLKHRAETKPQPKDYALTVEQEIKAKIDEELAGQAEMRKNLTAFPAADRARILESIKTVEAQVKSPEFSQALREEKLEERAREKASIERITKDWEATYPADPNAFAAKNLRHLLAGTEGVDFAAKLVTIQGEGGASLGFENEALRKKPWMWVECVLAGKEAVAAARAAALAWLQELGE